ncbi:hypothetical protein QJQ45_026025 [Haematococcus lacustris]|nr:hypothetical protein QJQ45_026025 [Haematococcus lacustris]
MEGEDSNFDPNVNTQPFRGRKPDPTVAQLQARLLRSKTLRKDRYTVVINATEKVVKLVCLLCGLQLCVSNISTAQESHSGACALQRALDVGAPPPPNPYEPMVPADVVDDVKKELALFFYTSGTAFARADNPHMKRALKLLGVDSPSAKQLRTTYLNNTHAVLQRRVATMMETLLMVMKVWSDLVSWAERWANDHGDPSGVNNVDPLFVLGVARLFKDRAKKHYQPVMAAARVLDPVNFIPTRPKAQPLPPMKDLTPEQQEDVVHVVARLAGVSQDVARHELRRFECGAWHHEMIRVANDIMSMSEPGQRNGRAVTIIAAASQRLTWWQIYAKPHFPALATAALRLLSVHVSTCASERNWSAWGRLFDDPRRSGLDMASAEKLIFIQTNDELAANYDSVDQSNQQDPIAGKVCAVDAVHIDELHAAAGQRLVVVDVYTAWCGPCKMIAPELEKMAEEWGDKVLQGKAGFGRQGRVVMSKIDCTTIPENKKWAMGQSVKALPTFLLFKEGKRVNDMTGAKAANLKKLIEAHM